MGTSSLRRLAQLRAAREDLDVIPLRGNVDTRLRKLAEHAEGLAAIVLAEPAHRLGRDARQAGCSTRPVSFPPPGRGRWRWRAAPRTRPAVPPSGPLTDELTFACLLAERALARELGGDCDTPLGAHAAGGGAGRLVLRAWVGLPDGSAWIADERSGALADPERSGERWPGDCVPRAPQSCCGGAREAAVHGG